MHQLNKRKMLQVYSFDSGLSDLLINEYGPNCRGNFTYVCTIRNGMSQYLRKECFNPKLFDIRQFTLKIK